MPAVILLLIIYLAFISLGLPDSILGVVIPALQKDWGISLGAGGVISMITIGGTIVSSFTSGHIIGRFGTGKIILISCLLTGSALFGFSFAPSYYWLLFLAVPLGLGGGSVDTALNNYVALHFKARHMNWLHSFWGVGATIGPLIMARTLQHSFSWRSGYRTISYIQLLLAVILMFSMPLWAWHNRTKKTENENGGKAQPNKARVFGIRGVKHAFAVMLLYCSVEISVGLWGSSFLVRAKGFSIENAASWMALYYGGITAGRFLAGFVSFKLTNVQMIRTGILTALAGTFFLFLPLPPVFLGPSFILTGLGLSPVFPAMLHETPVRFGTDMSQKIVGYQMGFGYIGSALIPPLLGLILQYAGVALFPALMSAAVLAMFIVSEGLRLIVR